MNTITIDGNGSVLTKKEWTDFTKFVTIWSEKLTAPAKVLFTSFVIDCGEEVKFKEYSEE